MIFNEDYDNTLWLLVAGSKKDSEMVCKLISCIPDNVYVEIQRAIKDYYDNKLDSIKGNVIYKINIDNLDEYDYYIEVKIKNDKLYFNVLRWKEDKERIEEDYKLILKGISLNELMNMDYDYKKSIANYSHEIYNIKNVKGIPSINNLSYDRRFSVERILFGFKVGSSLGKRKLVNVFKNIPDDMNVEDFKNEENIECLIKKRKRDKRG